MKATTNIINILVNVYVSVRVVRGEEMERKVRDAKVYMIYLATELDLLLDTELSSMPQI